MPNPKHKKHPARRRPHLTGGNGKFINGRFIKNRNQISS